MHRLPAWLSAAAFDIAIRLVVGLVLCMGCISAARAPIPGDAWFPAAGFATVPLAVLGMACGVALLSGWRLRRTAALAGAWLVMLLVVQLSRDRLFNTATHLGPLLAGLVVLLVRAGARPVGLLIARLTLGAIFIAQGWHGCFVTGPLHLARAVYVEPFASSVVPTWMLWVAGVSNPPTQLLTGVCLVLGLKTRVTAAVVMLFLVTIVFGHFVAAPFDPGPDLHDFALANFAWAAAIWWLAPTPRSSPPVSPAACAGVLLAVRRGTAGVDRHHRGVSAVPTVRPPRAVIDSGAQPSTR